MFESCKLHHPPDHDGQHHNSDDKTGDTYFCCPIRVQRPRVLRGGTTTVAMFLLFTAVFLISHMYTCDLSHRLDGLGGPIGPFLLNQSFHLKPHLQFHTHHPPIIRYTTTTIIIAPPQHTRQKHKQTKTNLIRLWFLGTRMRRTRIKICRMGGGGGEGGAYKSLGRSESLTVAALPLLLIGSHLLLNLKIGSHSL